VYDIDGLIDFADLKDIAEVQGRSELRYEPWTPSTQPRLQGEDEEPVDIFAAIRQGDILVHHPYDSFSSSVERFVAQAVADPGVLAIKQTVYRTSDDSPLVPALIRASERGKQAVCMVELKARFDEAANIVWARALERAGAHVAYGVLGLKTHSKIALVVRREGRGIRRYVHIGTGNYNSKTARGYVDLGLLTANPELGADVTDLFNVLTGHSRQTRYRKLLVAPTSLRSGLLALIDAERERHASDGDGRIVIKCNAIVDPEMIAALYAASSAGVQIDLIVRGMCSVRPGVPGISETIRVRSVIGRYLEHSRIFVFGQDERERFFIGSADLMERNLDRRVEAVTPVEDADSRVRLREIIEVMLSDDRRAWQLTSDDRWRRVEEIVSAAGGIDTFEALTAIAADTAE
jgi:polyphosphate kinase